MEALVTMLLKSDTKEAKTEQSVGLIRFYREDTHQREHWRSIHLQKPVLSMAYCDSL